MKKQWKTIKNNEKHRKTMNNKVKQGKTHKKTMKNTEKQ